MIQFLWSTISIAFSVRTEASAIVSIPISLPVRVEASAITSIAISVSVRIEASTVISIAGSLPVRIQASATISTTISVPVRIEASAIVSIAISIPVRIEATIITSISTSPIWSLSPVVPVVRITSGGVIPGVSQAKPSQEPGAEVGVVGPARDIQIVVSVSLQPSVAPVAVHNEP